MKAAVPFPPEITEHILVVEYAFIRRDGNSRILIKPHFLNQQEYILWSVSVSPPVQAQPSFFKKSSEELPAKLRPVTTLGVLKLHHSHPMAPSAEASWILQQHRKGSGGMLCLIWAPCLGSSGVGEEDSAI